MRAHKYPIEPVVWLWKDRIPEGMITVIGGRPGGSKSLFAVRLARDISKKGNVLLSCSEDSVKHMTHPRLKAAGANRRRVEILDPEPRFPEDIGAIKQQIERANAKALICDPVNMHLSEGISRYNDSIRRATTPLKKLAEQTGCAVVMIDHTLKSVPKSSHPLAAIGGASSGLAAAGRMVYIIGRDPEDKDRILLCNIKTNLREDPEPFEFTMDDADVEGFGSMSLLLDVGECPDYDVMKLLTKPGKGGRMGRPPTKREAANEFLIEYLTAAPKHERRATEIIEDAKQYGITKRTLEGAKAEAEIESIKRQNEWWWKLPQELIDVINAST